MPVSLLVLSLLAAFTSDFATAADAGNLCGIRLEGAQPDFSATEENWLCGSEESAAWKEIPPPQKSFFLRRFLQSRGYHQPTFRVDGDELVVNVGPRLEAVSFRVENAPPELHPERRRRLLGRTLNPALLDEARNWVERELQQLGYPCPLVAATATSDKGDIVVTVQAGEQRKFGPIGTELPPDLDPRILDRFTAFVEGQSFDIRLLELSSDRILAQDLYLSTYYDLNCENGFRVVRRFVPAPPRLITAGAGFDTERGPLLRARYRRVRIGPSANVWQTTLLATFREQSLESRFDWHFSGDRSSPLRLTPRLSFRREDEERFETLTYGFTPLLANEWEKPAYQLGGELGPALERAVTLRGPGERVVDSLGLIARVRATSHLFEYYARRPREGWSFSLDTLSRMRGFFSKETFARARFTHELLWNLGHRDPPFAVLGWRGFYGTFAFPERLAAARIVPPSERFFLGGDSDIRGFGRKELPGTEQGFFSALYQGVELRAGEWWDLALQPLVFVDLAKGSVEPGRLSPALYLAPGAGLRYESFIGSLRATLARGFTRNPQPSEPPDGWQFFLSLGREF